MNINKINNQKYTPAFGTYLGINMQEKILHAKQKNMFTKEQLANLEKIEDNGIDAILEIANRYVISSVNNKKGVMKIKKVINLTHDINKVEIADISHVYQPTASKDKFIFHTQKFLKIFNDDFNLCEKVKDAWEKLSKK